MINCLINAIKFFSVKPVNYKEVKKVQQELNENLTVFQERLIETFKKYMNVDPSSR